MLAELALSDAVRIGLPSGLSGRQKVFANPESVFDDPILAREVNRRARQLALNDWVAQTVSRAIQRERNRRSS